MNNIDRQYKELLEHIIRFGVNKKDRTGTGTKSIFGWQIRHNMKEGFPLLTTKKMGWKQVVAELLWFLRGDTNIKYLVDNDCNIWVGDAYKNYCNQIPSKEVIGSDSNPLRSSMVWKQKTDYSSGYPIFERYTQEEFINKIKTDPEFAKQWGDLGPIYGKQWRSWRTGKIRSIGGMDWDGCEPIVIDQIANSINLLKTDPDSRRNKVSAWNVGELDQMVLPPCHTDFQFYTRELSLEERQELQTKMFNGLHYFPHSLDGEEGLHREYDKNNVPRRAISLMWNQRSVDTFLGLPFNIASYALLLEIIAKEVNMIPDELIGNLGDTHLYLNHIEQAKEQITRTPFELPKLKLDDWYSTQGATFNTVEDIVKNMNGLCQHHCILKDYQSHPAIKAPLSN